MLDQQSLLDKPPVIKTNQLWHYVFLVSILSIVIAIAVTLYFLLEGNLFVGDTLKHEQDFGKPLPLDPNWTPPDVDSSGNIRPIYISSSGQNVPVTPSTDGPVVLGDGKQYSKNQAWQGGFITSISSDAISISFAFGEQWYLKGNVAANPCCSGYTVRVLTAAISRGKGPLCTIDCRTPQQECSIVIPTKWQGEPIIAKDIILSDTVTSCDGSFSEITNGQPHSNTSFAKLVDLNDWGNWQGFTYATPTNKRAGRPSFILTEIIANRWSTQTMAASMGFTICNFPGGNVPVFCDNTGALVPASVFPPYDSNAPSRFPQFIGTSPLYWIPDFILEWNSNPSPPVYICCSMLKLTTIKKIIQQYGLMGWCDVHREVVVTEKTVPVVGGIIGEALAFFGDESIVKYQSHPKCSAAGLNTIFFGNAAGSGDPCALDPVLQQYFATWLGMKTYYPPAAGVGIPHAFIYPVCILSCEGQFLCSYTP